MVMSSMRRLCRHKYEFKINIFIVKKEIFLYFYFLKFDCIIFTKLIITFSGLEDFHM